jgi:hypothetical protein
MQIIIIPEANNVEPTENLAFGGIILFLSELVYLLLRWHFIFRGLIFVSFKVQTNHEMDIIKLCVISENSVLIMISIMVKQVV